MFEIRLPIDDPDKIWFLPKSCFYVAAIFIEVGIWLCDLIEPPEDD